MRKSILLAVVALIVAALACEGTSGSAIGGGESCHRSGNNGTCDGTFSKLSGTYTKKIKADNVHVTDAIPVDVTVTVGSGTVRVSVKAPDGTVTSAEAKPGNSASLSGNSTGASDEFPVTFEAVGGDATDVSWSISYTVP